MRTKLVVLSLTFFAVAGVVGAALAWPRQPPATPDSVAEELAGKTQADVTARLGRPDIDYPADPKSVYAAEGVTRVWGYRRSHHGAPTFLFVHLDDSGTVKAVKWQDPTHP